MEMSFDRVLGIIGVLGIIIGAGVAIAMDPKSKGEMQFSIGCFVFSGIALSITIGIWAFKTDLSAIVRILLAAPLFASVCISMVEASRWAGNRYARATVESTMRHEPTQSAQKNDGATDLASVPPQRDGIKRSVNVKGKGATTSAKPLEPPQNGGLDPEIVKLRRDASDLFYRLFNHVNWFYQIQQSLVAQKDTTSTAPNRLLAAEFAKENITDIRDRLMTHIRMLPRPPEGKDRNSIYSEPLVPGAGLMPQYAEAQMSDIRLLLNEMERENNLAPSCTEVKLHYDLP